MVQISATICTDSWRKWARKTWSWSTWSTLFLTVALAVQTPSTSRHIPTAALGKSAPQIPKGPQRRRGRVLDRSPTWMAGRCCLDTAWQCHCPPLKVSEMYHSVLWSVPWYLCVVLGSYALHRLTVTPFALPFDKNILSATAGWEQKFDFMH